MANLGRVVRVMEILPVTVSESVAERETPPVAAPQEVVVEETAVVEARETVNV